MLGYMFYIIPVSVIIFMLLIEFNFTAGLQAAA